MPPHWWRFFAPFKIECNFLRFHILSSENKTKVKIYSNKLKAETNRIRRKHQTSFHSEFQTKRVKINFTTKNYFPTIFSNSFNLQQRQSTIQLNKFIYFMTSTQENFVRKKKYLSSCRVRNVQIKKTMLIWCKIVFEWSEDDENKYWLTILRQ